MNISLRWLNEYLNPGDVTAESADAILTSAGFPIEGTEDVAGDLMMDVEVTSNRGDCLSHIGAAREIAAASGRALQVPTPSVEPSDGPGAAGDALHLDNRVHDACPMFTARVIKGVKVGPSPDWMVRALEAIGQRSINNVVDVTNYVMFEFGQPSHVFDLATLGANTDGKPSLVIRKAEAGEPLKLLDGKSVKLKGDEIVVADAARAISLAGVMGGLDTEVTEKTVDVVLEAATWDPVAVRTAARRYDARTDASHRFERIVDPRTIDLAARRAAELIVKVAGGTLLDGCLTDGAEFKPATEVEFRPERCCDVLGIDIATDEIKRILNAHGVETADGTDGALRCSVPHHRPDLTREIDLIEEVIRSHGIDELPIHEMVPVRVPAPQASERAMHELEGVLTGFGFYETVTFSFATRPGAGPFVPSDLETLEVTERREADPLLRPSVIPSLLTCRKANQDGQVSASGGVRLFEVSHVFAQCEGKGLERRLLGLLADAPAGKGLERRQNAVRLMRTVIDSLVHTLHGPSGELTVTPAELPMSGYDKDAGASVELNGQRIGVLGLIGSKVQGAYDLREPVVAAELDVESLIAAFPPKATVHRLPKFPGTERDVSLVVGEDVMWSAVDGLVRESSMELLEGHDFVASFRGKQIGDGRKSLTVRLRFRDESRTLKHEEVDPQVNAFVDAAKKQLGADVRV